MPPNGASSINGRTAEANGDPEQSSLLEKRKHHRSQDDGSKQAIITAAHDQRGRNLKLVLKSSDEQKPSVDLELVAMIRKAEAARQQLFAEPSGTKDRAAERIARLAFLAPDIIMAILEGRQAPSLQRGAS